MKPYCSNHGTIIVLCSNSVKKNIYVSPGIDDKMFAVISIYIYIFLSFIFYLIKNHKPKQFLHIIFEYIFQRACLNYVTPVNI